MASNPCERRRTDLNGGEKREICVYKNAHPKATCCDIAAHFACQTWLENSHVSPTFSKNKVRMYKYYLKKSFNYIFEIIELYLYHIYVLILFAQPIHVLKKSMNYNYISSVPTQLGGGGGAARKLCHILSSVIFLGNRWWRKIEVSLFVSIDRVPETKANVQIYEWNSPIHQFYEWNDVTFCLKLRDQILIIMYLGWRPATKIKYAFNLKTLIMLGLIFHIYHKFSITWSCGSQ